MVPVNFFFERSVFEARSFLAVLVRMNKLFCRKKLAPRISVAHPQSFISNYAKSAPGPASLQADSPSGGSSGSSLFLQHSSTAHTASTLQSEERGSHRVQCCPLCVSPEVTHTTSTRCPFFRASHMTSPGKKGLRNLGSTCVFWKL